MGVCLARIHIADVFLAEVPAVKDEADAPVSVAVGLVHHELELRDVRDRPGVVLIEERHPVRPVEGYRQVEYGAPSCQDRILERIS